MAIIKKKTRSSLIKQAPFWIALFSLVVSFLALSETKRHNANQIDLQKTHNKLSVKPYLSFISSLSANNKSVSLSVANEGIGPAVIKGVSIFYKNVEEDSYGVDGCLDLSKAMEIEFPFNCGWLKPGSILATNSSQMILGSIANSNEQERLKLASTMSEFGISICYCSFYEDCWNASFGDVRNRQECDEIEKP